MSTQLRTALHQHLDDVTPPVGDPARARQEGTRLRRRRRATATLPTLALATVLGLVVVHADGGPEAYDLVPAYASLGRLDYSEGLRAYADPGVRIWIGGRSFDASELDYLDTDAVGTSHGVVFYDDGRPLLLDERGDVRALVGGSVEADPEFHPTAKADSTAPHVAWATLDDDVATITVHDLSSQDTVASTKVECGDCDDLVIDALDRGAVFYRLGDTTYVWDAESDATEPFAGAGTRVADVRNGVVLYDGPAPTSPVAARWRLVSGAIDSQLTHDGRYVLSWSSRLEPTRPGDDPVVLEQGPVEPGLGFWTVDTDGSVLVAAPSGKYPNYEVHDCEVPSGSCTSLGRLRPTGGDPAFMGNDM